MKEFTLKILIVLVALVGQVMSIGVFIWQSIANMFGFWFWFSFQSTIGWGLFIALMRDVNFVFSNKGEEK